MESIATIGYEAATVKSMQEKLLGAGVDLVVDIRARASSRRPGFAKTRLAANLAEVGIDYLHLRGLGTPADGRTAARAGRHDELREIYLDHLTTPAAQTDLATPRMRVALTRAVSPGLGRCELTHIAREPIDVARCAAQHAEYERCLAELGCAVRRLPPEPSLPDAVFVEDTALVLPEVAVVTRPGAPSRRAETGSVAAMLREYRELRWIEPPGTLEGGDVLCIGRKVFVGQSQRSNGAALVQLREILHPLGYTIQGVETEACLHLKTAVTQVAEDAVVLNPEWVDADAFAGMERIAVDATEPFGANAVRVGSAVLFPAAYPRTRRRLERHGIEVRTAGVSELAKAEAGLTCCSLIFEA